MRGRVGSSVLLRQRWAGCGRSPGAAHRLGTLPSAHVRVPPGPRAVRGVAMSLVWGLARGAWKLPASYQESSRKPHARLQAGHAGRALAPWSAGCCCRMGPAAVGGLAASCSASTALLPCSHTAARVTHMRLPASYRKHSGTSGGSSHADRTCARSHSLPAGSCQQLPAATQLRSVRNSALWVWAALTGVLGGIVALLGVPRCGQQGQRSLLQEARGQRVQRRSSLLAADSTCTAAGVCAASPG